MLAFAYFNVHLVDNNKPYGNGENIPFGNGNIPFDRILLMEILLSFLFKFLVMHSVNLDCHK